MQELQGATPGPWATSNDAVPDGFTQVTVYAESDGERVATVFRTQANAQLIAAAPDLLDAALTVVDILGDTVTADDLRLMLRTLGAAIAKATGRE